VQFADGTLWDRVTLLAQEVSLFGGGNDVLTARGNGARVLYGNDGNDTLYGGDTTSDRLFGGSGDDRLYSGAGNDTLDGGTGNDYLDGGAGNDTYVFRRGNGFDTINAYDNTAGRIDTLVMEGLNPGDIQLEKRGNVLVLIDKVSGDGAFIQDFYVGASYQLDQVVFADGTVWNRATLLAQVVDVIGGSDNDTLNGRYGGPNALYGKDGNDTLLGGDGAEEADRLYGENGDDRLYGGAGNDYLDGGAGNDTYVFRRGSGYDAISAYDSTAGRIETLVMEGLNPGDIRLEKRGNVLVLIDKVSGAGAFIQDIYSGPAYQLDQVVFADGTVWNRATLLAQVVDVIGGSGNDSLSGRNGGPNALYGKDGNDTLYGGDGADRLDGENGDDRLYGGAGNDVLIGGIGNNVLDGGSGADEVSYAAATASVSLANTAAQITGGAGTDTLVGIENLTGSQFNDTLTGSALANVLGGGAGNDTLSGGLGNDTYRFARGGGADLVIDSDATAGNTDLAQFAAGIAADQLWFSHLGNDLQVSLIGTPDTLTIQNWYAGAASHVEQFRTADNKLLLDSQVEALVQAMAAFAPPSAGPTSLPPAYLEALAPVLAANWQ